MFLAFKRKCADSAGQPSCSHRASISASVGEFVAEVVAVVDGEDMEGRISRRLGTPFCKEIKLGIDSEAAKVCPDDEEGGWEHRWLPVWDGLM